MKLMVLSALFLSIAATASAQATGMDRLTPPLPTAAERKAADVASWGTVLAAVALDARATWKSRCEGSWDDCSTALTLAGIRYGATIGGAQLIKMLVRRNRPCAPSCGIDSPDSSFYSMHTALAFQGIGGPRLAVSLPLAIGTGGLRIAAGKHYLTDVLAGAAAGYAASFIR